MNESEVSLKHRSSLLRCRYKDLLRQGPFFYSILLFCLSFAAVILSMAQQAATSVQFEDAIVPVPSNLPAYANRRSQTVISEKLSGVDVEGGVVGARFG